jgi:hypothetical protein
LRRPAARSGNVESAGTAARATPGVDPTPVGDSQHEPTQVLGSRATPQDVGGGHESVVAQIVKGLPRKGSAAQLADEHGEGIELGREFGLRAEG